MVSIAEQYGFSWETLWNHASNASLKANRKNPNVLFPGDLVRIPEKRPKTELRATENVHKFRRLGVPAKLNIRMVDAEGKPRSGLKYRLELEQQVFEGTTGGDGLISHPIPPGARQGLLKIGAEEYRLAVGSLNPVEEISGVQARLKNLGYYMGEITGETDDATLAALREFQKRSGLTESGVIDQETLDKLKSTHEI